VNKKQENGMKSFIRNNPTIAFGLGLPLLLVLVMLLASGVAGVMVNPPKYDVIYMTGYNDYNNGARIQVVGNKAQITYSNTNNYAPQAPRIWHYSAKTGAAKEIPLLIPPELLKQTPPSSGVIPLPELDALQLDASTISPDGYEFQTAGYGGSEPFSPFIFSSRYRNEAVLYKQGNRVRLPNSDSNYYSNNTRFIGWVVTP
jgi:hypothetical protein